MKTSWFTQISRILRVAAVFGTICVAKASAESPYEIAYETLHILTEEGYNVREDYYQKPLTPDVGKGIRVQLFKGNDYVFVGALAEDVANTSLKVQILDSEGHVAIQETDPIVKGRVVIVKFSPKRTGYYVVAMRQISAATRDCALFVGFR